jgi:uncharacterized protein (TIGR00369 family)
VNRLSEDAKLECRICWYVYEPDVGDEIQQIPPGTPFHEESRREAADVYARAVADLPTVQHVNEYLREAFPSVAESGYRCEAIGDGTATARWTFDATQLRPGRYISGPTIFTLADTALWFAVFTEIGIQSMAVTSEMSIRFLRPAQDGDLIARARIDSVGTRRIVGTIELWIDGAPDRLVAIAQGSYARPSR